MLFRTGRCGDLQDLNHELANIEPQVLVASGHPFRASGAAFCCGEVSEGVVASCPQSGGTKGLKDVTLQTAVGTEQSKELLLVKMLLKRLGSLSDEENGRAGPKVVGQSTGLNADKVEDLHGAPQTEVWSVLDNCTMAWKLIRRVFVAGQPGFFTNLETWTQLRTRKLHVPDALALEEHLRMLHEKLRAHAAARCLWRLGFGQWLRLRRKEKQQARAVREAAEQEASAKQAALKQQAPSSWNQSLYASHELLAAELVEHHQRFGPGG